jgi:hypothetical protein
MRPRYLLFIALAAGCTLAAQNNLDRLYGRPDPARYDAPAASESARTDWEKVEQVLDRRCVVCHACYDAPCQLKLTSYEGVTRGGSKDNVYAPHLVTATLTRLFVDAQTSEQWRRKGFHPVLNERTRSPEADRAASVMHRILELKRKHAPESGILPADRYDFSLNRAQQCASIEEMNYLEKEHPELGMPFGLPPLSDEEYRTITRWIEAGAPYAPPPAPDAAHAERVTAWETFLNGDSLKQQLMSRYIYEHWFLAHLYFDDLPEGEYFDLVRSRTPPGSPVDIIATRRPYDDPGVPRVYYRLRRVEETRVAKTHMPLALSTAKMKHLRELFLDADYQVTKLPAYGDRTGSNPFVTFQQIPSRSRYRLMLEEAQFTIMGFIKGPVCRGQVALNVIDDLFWVAFVDPELQQSELKEYELAEALNEIELPAADEDSLPLLKWKKYSNSETRYLAAKTEALNRNLGGKQLPTLRLIWDGDGSNRNAALTVFRHFDSATVVQGFVGRAPETAWIVGYPLLERIHYLLVAGYDVYGRVGHQLTTRLYMDFLRMEGESNFLALLPMASRDSVRDRWYRDVGDDVKQYLQGDKAYFAHETGIVYRTNDPLAELYGLLQKRLARVMSHRYDVTTRGLSPQAARSLERLASLQGKAVTNLPESSFLTVVTPQGAEHHYTLLRNSAHLNVSTLFEEAKNRVPDEDTLTLVDGFLGSYPNAFFRVTSNEIPDFVASVAHLSDEASYAELMGRYGIRRTDARFWQQSDSLYAAYRKGWPIEAGLFDYGRYENR